METRELRYFVALAEEGHFGRAAARIGIAQPPLSRAIRQLERRVGVELVQRGSRGVTLTAAGQVLYREAEAILDSVAAAVRRTRHAAQPRPTLRLALKAGGDSGLLPDVLAAFDREAGAVPVELRFCGVGEQPALIRDGDCDVALMHRTRGSEDTIPKLEVLELLAEPQVVVLPCDHRLAGRAAVHLRDLDGETIWPGSPPGADDGLQVRDAGQLMQLIALGQAVAVLSQSVRPHLRGDLVGVPVLDAPESVLLVAWGEGSRSGAVAAFVRAALTVAERARSRSAAAT